MIAGFALARARRRRRRAAPGGDGRLMGKIIVALVLAGLIYMWWRRQGGRARADARRRGARRCSASARAPSLDDIRAAHRRLIARVHPDAGGSAGLATRVNAARDAADRGR